MGVTSLKEVTLSGHDQCVVNYVLFTMCFMKVNTLLCTCDFQSDTSFCGNTRGYNTLCCV